jgi:hypothetical protein
MPVNDQLLKATIDSLIASVDSLAKARMCDHLAKVNADYSHSFSVFPSDFWPNATLISLAGIMVPIVISIVVGFIIFFYLKYRNREKIEMIRMGMNPYEKAIKPLPSIGTKSLFAGLVFLFIGGGFIISNIVAGNFFGHHHNSSSIVCLAIGAACIIYWKLTEGQRKIAEEYYKNLNGREIQPTPEPKNIEGEGL